MAFCTLRRMLTTTLNEVYCFWPFDLVDDFSLNAGARDHRHTNSAAYHQNFIELYHVTSISCQLLNAQNITGLYPILLAAGFHYRKHLRFLYFFAPFGPPFGCFGQGHLRLRV